MKQKAFAFSLVAVALLAFLVGFGSANPTSIPKQAPGSLAHVYRSIKELAQDSPVIAEVEVLTDPTTIPYEGLLFATNRARVVAEFKGPGGLTDITILDNGGLSGGQEFALGGMPLLHAGDRYVLFLYKYQGPVTAGDAYMIRGVWQGKIRITGDGALGYVGPLMENVELQRDIQGKRRDFLYTMFGSR